MKNKLSDYICIYDNVLGNKKNNVLSRLLTQNIFPFKPAAVFSGGGGQLIDKTVRNTEKFSLDNITEKSNTIIHYTNLFCSCLHHHIKIYAKDINTTLDCNVTDMQILKYKVGGFYKQHIDSGRFSPRTLSFIYLVNEDYEGGELVIELPKIKETIPIEVKKDRLIIWPSNFMYPHKVNPVIKGIKYSVVAWAV